VIVIVLLALAGLLGRFAYQAWIKKKAFEQHEYPDYRYLTCLKIVELLNADMIAESSLQTSLTLRPNPVAAPPTPAATPPLNAPANAGVSPPVLGQAAAPPVLNPNQPPPLASPNPAGVPPVINPASGSAQSMPFGDQSGKRGHVSWMSRHTHETWLQLSSQLQDGTKFDFSLREDSQAYGEHFPYRAMSGKTKTKLKARKRLQWIVSLRLRFKEKRYPAGPAESAQLTQLIQLPEGAKVKKLDVSGQEFRLTAATAPKKLRAKRKGSTDIVGAWNGMQPTDEDWQPLTQFSAMTFLSLYQALNASRKV
jgi:hypothetical protein